MFGELFLQYLLAINNFYVVCGRKNLFINIISEYSLLNIIKFNILFNTCTSRKTGKFEECNSAIF